jgi:hypothetical protein
MRAYFAKKIARATMLTIKAMWNLNLAGSYTIDVSKGLGSTAFMCAYLIPHQPEAGFDLHKGFLGCNSIVPRNYGPFV